MKKVLKHPFVQALLSKIFSSYLSFVWHTSKGLIEGQEHVLSRRQRNHPVIIAFWHSRMSLAPFAWWPDVPFYMMISNHSDGRLIAKIVSHLGIDTVYGSSSHQGRSALYQLVSHLKQGHCVGITPDGPRGPREEVKKGVFALSLLSQCDVLCLSFAASRAFFFKSWDRFCFPLPFGRCALVYTQPKHALAQKGSQETFLHSVKEALQQAEKRAQELLATL